MIISPYQHQIHHSNAERHCNKNFGVVFAFWDRIFGTLELSKNNIFLEIEFGLSKNEKHKLSNSLFDLYFQPIYELLKLNKKV